MKSPTEITLSQDSSIELTNTAAVNDRNGTQRDESDMNRMGKIQQLKVCFQQTLLLFYGN